MKTASLMLLLLGFSLTGEAQNNWGKISDSLALISRKKADKVLSHFDTIPVAKILYSLDDKYFYLIIKDKPIHKEYFVILDSLGEIRIARHVKALPINEELQQHYQKLLSAAEPIFDLSMYHTNYVTKIPEATNSNGRQSYFVLKDTDGKRYGEYNLSAITTPMPIKPSLWAYLVMRSSDEMAKDK